MAFRQPQQRPQVVRQVSFTQPSQQQQTAQASSARRPLEESQDWVLFSPQSVAQSQTTCTAGSQTARTTDLSRDSDFGSLETGQRSERIADHGNNVIVEEEDDDEADLDSLDDGLHAFHTTPSPKLDHSGGSILPTHDGLGTFRTSYTYADNEGMQDHLWQYERFNPQRRKAQRRRSSVHKRLEAMEEDKEVKALDPQEERTLRVEKWRLEQSKAVLEEIEQETRRRQRRMSRASVSVRVAVEATAEQESYTPRTRRFDSEVDSSVTHITDKEESESFWQRITRRVIQDLIGLDENTLSVIFGEELAADMTATPTQRSPLTDLTENSHLAAHPGNTWEKRLLERIARELGILVHQLTEYDGAFSTYGSSREATSNSRPVPITSTTLPTATAASRHRRPINLQDTSDTLFNPTLPRAHVSPTTATDASLWGIEEEPTNPHQTTNGPKPLDQDPEYWERNLDVRMIFNYLRNRFSSRPTSPSPAAEQPTNGPLPASWANAASALGTSPESQRRADLIRKHHPLVSREAERRRESVLRRHHAAMSSILQKRSGDSSCASQSTKRSRSRLSSGHSRKYWDFPGGAGSQGSVVGSIVSGLGEAGIGSWGEL